MYSQIYYYIPAHVHFAIEADTVVFMNLRTDQYSMLLGEKAQTFQSLLSDPTDGTVRTLTLGQRGDGDSNAREQALLAELQECRLVASEGPAVRTCQPIILPHPDTALLEPETLDSPVYGAQDIWRLLRSCVIATGSLSCLGLERTLLNITHRRELANTSGQFPWPEARRLVRVYNRLRPLFPKNYVCLFDSVALLEFLAQYDCLPYLIFAATLEPWEAHCWVQYEAVSFNEDAERARTYLPILAV